MYWNTLKPVTSIRSGGVPAASSVLSLSHRLSIGKENFSKDTVGFFLAKSSVVPIQKSL